MSKHTFIVRVEQRTDLPDIPIDADYMKFIVTNQSLVDVISIDEVIESPMAYEKENM